MNGKIFDLHYDRAVVKAELKNQICIFNENALSNIQRKLALNKIKKYRKQLRRLNWQIFCTWFNLHVYNRLRNNPWFILTGAWLLCVGIVGGIIYLIFK